MIAYFDCSSGISGDMTLGALVDAGVPPSELQKELSRIPLKGYELKVRNVKRAGLRATKVDVVIDPKGKGHESEVRKWKDIKKVVDDSTLSRPIKKQGIAIFKRLFEAEARVHGGRYDRVHLHELGAVDCIVDIFGTLIGLDLLGISSVYSSPLNLGSGTLKSDHGILPVPAPASVELLRKVPVYASDISFELTTPTGAVLISSLSSGFGPMPAMNIEGSGSGAGNKNFKEQPNIMRIIVGRRSSLDEPGDKISVVETNIDDMNPQIYEYVMERLFAEGALDVFMTQIMMKKNRPGIKLSVLTESSKRESLTKIILDETSSIGVRFYDVERKVMDREIKTRKTKYGDVAVKVTTLGRKRRKVSAEYEVCKKIARKFNIPLIEVMKAASEAK